MHINNANINLELDINNFKFQKKEYFARYLEKKMVVWLNGLKIKGKCHFLPQFRRKCLTNQ